MQTLVIRAALLVLFLLSLDAVSMAADNFAGTVKESKGLATITRTGKDIPAKTGLDIMKNDVLTTGENGWLAVIFEDKSRLVLGASSKMRIEQYLYPGKESGLLFDLSKGFFRTVTGKIVEANPEGFNMRTPLAIVGIRGSDVFAHVESERNRVGAVSLGQGHVLRLTTDEDSRNIDKGGLYSRIGPDGSISEPKPIPALLKDKLPPLPEGETGQRPALFLPPEPRVVPPVPKPKPRVRPNFQY